MLKRSVIAAHRLSRAMSSQPAYRQDLERALRLLPVEGKHDVFYNAEKLFIPPGARGVFGGTLVAQALWAAMKTVPDTFVPHSLHSYFIRGGEKNHKIEYAVERIRDGRSFISREVKAYQKGRLIFSEMISFSLASQPDLPQKQLEHSKPYPASARFDQMVSPQDTCLDEVSTPTILKLGGFFETIMARFKAGAAEYKVPHGFWTGSPDHPDNSKEPHEIEVDFFFRQRVPYTDPKFHYVALAYSSDSYLLISAMKFHNRPLHSAIFSVSLDHSIYFHKQPNVNNWTLYHISHPKSGDRRKLLVGDLYDEETKEMVATVIQEGLVIVDDAALKAKL